MAILAILSETANRLSERWTPTLELGARGCQFREQGPTANGTMGSVNRRRRTERRQGGLLAVVAAHKFRGPWLRSTSCQEPAEPPASMYVCHRPCGIWPSVVARRISIVSLFVSMSPMRHPIARCVGPSRRSPPLASTLNISGASDCWLAASASNSASAAPPSPSSTNGPGASNSDGAGSRSGCIGLLTAVPSPLGAAPDRAAAWPSAHSPVVLRAPRERRRATARDMKRYFRNSFPPWNFLCRKLRNRASLNYTKAPPAWLGGGIVRSDANPHPGPLPLGR